ncbi:MAG TPA: hypothetical protein PKE38_13570, partial [Ignavibacteriaceae bacterium]|nr:hypothetical protein [Ignavibacteriaceae bacterium]
MKIKPIHIIIMCFCAIHFVMAQNPTEDLKKAEANFLQNPENARNITLKILEKNLNDEQRLKALFILTNTSNLTGRLADAIKYGNEGLLLAQKEKETLTEIKLYLILGNVYQSIPLNEKTKDYLNRAEKLAITQKLPDSLRYIEGNIYYLKGM